MSGRRQKMKRALERQRYVQRFMATYIAALRQILKRAWPAYERRHPGTPGPCHTCAFNPSTDAWRGFEKTAFGLMNAIRKGEPFYCHEGLTRSSTGEWYYDPALPPPARCRGWEAIADEPETAGAAGVAARKIGPAPTWPWRSKPEPR